MDLRSSVSSFTRWLRRLGTNHYFWGGLGALLVIAAGVYILFNAFLMPSYTRHDVSVKVPNVEEQPFEQAREAVKAHGLQVERQVGRYNPNVPRDVVVDQNPPPESPVKPGRRVYLTVNSGRIPSVRIPDLAGTSMREAKNRLTSLGLKVGSTQEDSIPSPYPNTITRQRPEPGDSLLQGKEVDLWYSTGLGSATTSVPNLVGLPVDEAQQRLLERKLRSVVVEPGSTDAGSQRANRRDGAALDADAEPQRLFVRSQGRAPGKAVRTGMEIRLYTTTDSTRARAIRSVMPDTTAAPANPAPADTSGM